MTATARLIFAVLSLLTAFTVPYTTVAEARLYPDPTNWLGWVATWHYLGLLVGAAVFPKALSSLCGKKISGKMTPGAFIWLIVLGVVVLTSPAVRFFNAESVWTVPEWRAFLSFANGMASAPAYAAFFSRIPLRRHGLAVGLVTSFSLVLIKIAADGGDASSPVAWSEMFVAVQSGAVVLYTLLTVALLFIDGENMYLGPLAKKAHGSPPSVRRSQLPRLLAAMVIFFLLNGFLDGVLFTTMYELSYPNSQVLNLVLVPFCPLLGYVLDRWRRKSVPMVFLACSALFILSASLAAGQVDDAGYLVVFVIAVVGQNAFAVTMTVVMAGLARGWWFCLAFTATWILRFVSFAGRRVINWAYPGDSGVALLAAIVAGIVFYLLIKDVRIPPEEDIPDPAPPSPVRAGAGSPVAELDETSPNAAGIELSPAADAMEKAAGTAAFSQDGGSAADPESLLSPREGEVAALLVRGAGTREIAEVLAISEHTVKVHVRSILDKYNVPTRKAFIALAIAKNRRDTRRRGPQ